MRTGGACVHRLLAAVIACVLAAGAAIGALEQPADQAALTDPALRQIAEQNRQLTLLRTATLAPQMETASSQLQETRERRAALEDDLENVQDKVEKVGLSKALGLLLRKKRAELPDLAEHRRRLQALQSEIADAQAGILEYDESRAKAAHVEERLREFMAGLEGGQEPAEWEQIESVARDLLTTRSDLLKGLYLDYDSHFTTLVDLSTAERELIKKARDYAGFVDGSILWFRSSAPLGPSDLGPAWQAVSSRVSPTEWAGVLREVAADARRRPLLHLLTWAAFACLLAFRRRLREILRKAGERVSRAQTDRMSHTLRGLGATVLLAAPVPLLLGFEGLALASRVQAPAFARAVGSGLEAAALALLTLGLLRAAAAEGGLADAHFRARARALKVLRRSLRWATPLLAVAAFIVCALEAQDVEADKGSLGRLAFIAGMAASAALFQRVFRRRCGLLQEVLERRAGGWLDRLRWAWYSAMVATPLALAVLAAAGYYYTALVLTWRLLATFWLCIALLLAYGLMLRWLFVARRKMAMEEARKRRVAQEETEGESAAPGSEQPAPDEPEMTIHSISEQSRELLHGLFVFAVILMLWFVWSDLVPAVKGVTLGTISLAELGLAVITLVVTLIAAKDIPGLLEMVVLQRLPIESGVRFAITRISRYAITVVGIVLAFRFVGVVWDDVQWLAAAVTVGLGFGLQEIFANFVSGLIILFERPMRVGDTVTVGDITGTVTRIRIRATTITDWDRKELVVPNKEFITGRLVNWTLSDRILRVVIPVGIAYGSDTDLAVRLMLKAARENAMVLDDPPPSVIFKEFGDSSLNFDVRAFVPSIESFLPVKHELHMAIDRAFREAGVEISFPQRDIHIRSISQALPIVDERKEE